MKCKNFELGKEFDFGENFVADYEKETLELNKDQMTNPSENCSAFP